MGRSEIIKRFLKAGLQLDRDALEHLEKNEDKVESIIEKLGYTKEKFNVVTMSAIAALVDDQRPQVSVKITKMSVAVKTSMTDLINSLAERFGMMRAMLEGKGMEKLVSINKISPGTKDFSLICMISSVDDDMADVEDTTGTAKVQLPTMKEGIQPDDVVGLVCEQRDNKIFVKSVVWPDVPMSRGVGKTAAAADMIFAGEDAAVMGESSMKVIMMKDGGFDISYVLPSFKITGIESGSRMESPFTIDIDGVKIFVLTGGVVDRYRKFWGEGDVGKNILKRRYLEISGRAGVMNETVVLSDVPDIIVVPSQSPSVANYKGTTIISLSGGTGYHILLSTREVKEL